MVSIFYNNFVLVKWFGVGVKLKYEKLKKTIINKYECINTVYELYSVISMQIRNKTIRLFF